MSSKIKFSLISLLMANVIYFIYLACPNIPKGNQWDYIEIYLMPFYENFSLANLWSDGTHPYALSALLFILNSLLFSLNFKAEAIFCALSLIFIYQLIDSQYLKKYAHWGLALIIMGAIFHIPNIVIYTWSLSTISFLNIFIYLAILIYFVKTKNKRLFSSFAIPLLFILLNKNFATLAIISIIFTLIYLKEKKEFIFSLFFSLVIGELIFRFFIHPPVTNLTMSINKFFSYYFQLISIFTLHCVMPVNLLLEKYSVDIEIIKKLSYISFFFTFIVFALNLKEKDKEKNILSFSFMTLALLFNAAICLYRVYDEKQIFMAMSPRYASIHLVGSLALFMALNNLKHYKIFKTINPIIYISYFISICILNEHNWAKKGGLIYDEMKTKEILINNSFTDSFKNMPFHYKGHVSKERFKKSMSFLKEKNMSFYQKKEGPK